MTRGQEQIESVKVYKQNISKTLRLRNLKLGNVHLTNFPPFSSLEEDQIETRKCSGITRGLLGQESRKVTKRSHGIGWDFSKCAPDTSVKRSESDRKDLESQGGSSSNLFSEKKI